MTTVPGLPSTDTPAFMRFRPVGLPPDTVIDAFDTCQPRTVMFPLLAQAYNAAFKSITGGHPLEAHGGPRDGTVTYTTTGGLQLTDLDEELSIVTHTWPGRCKGAGAQGSLPHVHSAETGPDARHRAGPGGAADRGRRAGVGGRRGVEGQRTHRPAPGWSGVGTNGRTPPVHPAGKDGLVVAGKEGMLAVIVTDNAIALTDFAWTVSSQHDPEFVRPHLPRRRDRLPPPC